MPNPLPNVRTYPLGDMDPGNRMTAESSPGVYKWFIVLDIDLDDAHTIIANLVTGKTHRVPNNAEVKKCGACLWLPQCPK